MTPRKPTGAPGEDMQEDIQRAVHDAPGGQAPVSAPASNRQLAGHKHDQPLLQTIDEVDAHETQVEIDRAETYLKGPTVFAA